MGFFAGLFGKQKAASESEEVGRKMLPRLGELVRRLGGRHVLLFSDGAAPACGDLCAQLDREGCPHTQAAPEDLARALTEAPERTVLLAAGDMAARSSCAAVLGAWESTLPEPQPSDPTGQSRRAAVPLLFWQTDFASAMTLPPVGERLAELTVTDVSCFAAPGTAAFSEGVIRAMQLGMCVDADLFAEVYSSFDLEKLTSVARLILGDIAAAEQNGSRARQYLNFGRLAAEAVKKIAPGELTEGEALTVGMELEMRIGVRAGRCRPDALHDLDGAISYYGFPRRLDCTKEELLTALCGGHTPDEPVTLALPQRIGKCRLWETDCGTVGKLIEEVMENEY